MNMDMKYKMNKNICKYFTYFYDYTILLNESWHRYCVRMKDREIRQIFRSWDAKQERRKKKNVFALSMFPRGAVFSREEKKKEKKREILLAYLISRVNGEEFAFSARIPSDRLLRPVITHMYAQLCCVEIEFKTWRSLCLTLVYITSVILLRRRTSFFDRLSRVEETYL